MDLHHKTGTFKAPFYNDEGLCYIQKKSYVDDETVVNEDGSDYSDDSISEEETNDNNVKINSNNNNLDKDFLNDNNIKKFVNNVFEDDKFEDTFPRACEVIE